MQVAFLEIGKDRRMNSPLKPPEGTQSCRHIDFSPMKLISDFLSPGL